MRRQAIRLFLVALILLLGVAAVHAEPAQQQSQVQITSPEMNAELRGVVAIRGSASAPNFQFYKVEFGVGPNPAQWAIIGGLHETPILNGQLEVWDTSRLPDGVYSLRLQVVKKDGNFDEFLVRQFSIANSRPSATPIVTTTATPLTTPTTPPLATTPRPTATLKIIAPTAALAMPSPTPTLVRPAQKEVFPMDPKGWSQAFCFGALAMGAVFVLLGIVFGLRRLL